MKATLTRIHMGLGMGEVGVQFEITDGAGGTVTQRAFVVVAGSSFDAMWSAVEAALSRALDALPVDMPPGNVTSALMRQRTAEAACEQAKKDLADAQTQHAEVNAEIQAKRAEAQQLAADLAAMRASVAAAPE